MHYIILNILLTLAYILGIWIEVSCVFPYFIRKMHTNDDVMQNDLKCHLNLIGLHATGPKTFWRPWFQCSPLPQLSDCSIIIIIIIKNIYIVQDR